MNNTIKKISSIGLSVTTAVWLSGAAMVLPVASAATVDELQAQISNLLAQIQQLQGQLSSAQGQQQAASYNFTRDLTLGSKGDDVKALQQFLNGHGVLVAGSGAGSPGNETTYFGTLTKGALAQYQGTKGIYPAVGYFGPKTRAYIASLVVAPTTPSTPGAPTAPIGAGLAVALALDTPAAMTIGSGTAFNPALKVSVTAGSSAVNITGVILQKGGFVSNTNLNGVDIVDAAGVRHGNVITSINADNTITLTFPSAPITVAAGQSTSFLVRFNLVTGSISGTVAFSIQSASAIMADTTAISGSFPITGNAMNIVSGASSLASTTFDVLTSTGSSTLNVDPNSAQEITKFRIRENSSNEGVNLYSLTLYNYGNAAATSYKDVQLIDQTGNVLATSQPSGQYVTFNLATPYFIDKGLTKDFTVKAKLIGGTTQTINLVVYNNYDIGLRGATTLVSVLPGPGTVDTSFPIGNAFNVQTIGSGTATLTRTSDSPSTALVPGANNVVFAKYSFKPSGESMEVRQVAFYIATSTTAGNHALTGTVYVKVNNAVVYSVGASSLSALGTNTVNLSSYPVVTAGVDNYITVEGSIPSTATAVDSYQAKAFDIAQVKRLITGDLVDPGVAPVDGIALAVKAAALSVTTLSVPSANSVVVGINGYTLAQIQLNSSAGGEDVNVSKIVVTDTISGSDYAGVNTLQMYNGNPSAGGVLLTTTASTANNANTVTFNFSTPITVARSSPVTLYLTGNMTTSTVPAHTFNVVSSASAVTATGVSTGNSLTSGTDVTFTGNGQTQTIVNSGSLTVSLVSGSGASPSTNQVASVGTTGGTWFAFKLTSLYETQKITSLRLTATSSGSTGLSTSTLRNIALYQDTGTTPITQKGQFDSCASGQCIITFPSAGATSDNILSAPVPTTGTTIYVKADIAGGGTADLANSFKFSIASTTHITVKGSQSGSTAGTVTGMPTASGFTFVVPQNVVIEATSPTTAGQVGTPSGQTVGVFKITNNGTAPILLSTSSLTFANGGVASSSLSFKLYASAVGGGQSDTSGWGSGNGYAAPAGTTGASSTINFATTSISAAEQQIDGGSWRYFTLKTNGAAANNDTFQFSISALGSIKYDVAESSLGYSGNPSVNSDLSDTIYNLYVTGIPALASVTAKS